jgi:hypothetical protein
MYIDKDISNAEIVVPNMFYSSIHTNFTIKINEVFYFTDEVKENSKKIFLYDKPYVSIHLRLGDKYLETDPEYILCKDNTRDFSEENIYKFIENNENIFFCCDNNSYKLKIKEKYPNIIITNCKIGHTSLNNTTNEQILDAITEFYILTNSQMIYGASYSGFSIVASKFNNIPFQYSYSIF